MGQPQQFLVLDRRSQGSQGFPVVPVFVRVRVLLGRQRLEH